MRSMLIVMGITGILASGIPQRVAAVQIPLEQVSVNGDTASNGAIGYVDIDRVFREHPQTERSRAEFTAEVEKRRATAGERQKALETLNQVLQSSGTILQQVKNQLADAKSAQAAAAGDAAAVTVSSTAVLDLVTIKAKENEIAVLEESLAGLRQDIEKRTMELTDSAAKDQAYLQEWEEKRTSEVLGDLYDILQDIATAEHLTIIFDKTNILYGQGARDISDLVRERMKGR
jgi:Skp family chaperone for outer membrane proteins